METETFANEGPLRPCGCIVGDPMCHCGADEGRERTSAVTYGPSSSAVVQVPPVLTGHPPATD